MKIFLLVLLMAIMAFSGTAIAQEPQPFEFKCSLIPTNNSSKEEGHYINPKQISHLITVIDTESVSTGTSGRYILLVSMTNGEVLLYSRYISEQLRRNAIKHINLIVIACNQ